MTHNNKIIICIFRLAHIRRDPHALFLTEFYCCNIAERRFRSDVTVHWVDRRCSENGSGIAKAASQ